MNRLRLGTRTSTMAVQVATNAKQLIESSSPHVAVDILPFSSLGDQYQGDLKKLGGKGAFISNLEQRLLNNEIDCAIHALKDIPGDVPPHPDLVVCTFLKRGDPRDALILRDGVTLDTLNDQRATIGTSSIRRHIQLKRMYPHINVVPLRGNADTRLKKLAAGEFDGIVLSKSGLDYLGMADKITKCFDATEMIPSVGQGVLCLQVRREDFEKCPFLMSINHSETQHSIGAERALLKTLQGDCYSAIAAHCHRENGAFRLRAAVFCPQTLAMIDQSATATDMADLEALGTNLAHQLLEKGAREFMAAR